MDQGASQAVPIAFTNNRLDAGKLEVALKAHVADKTNWRKMLQGQPEKVDLMGMAHTLLESAPADLEWQKAEEQPIEIEYPVSEYPEKVKSLNFDKTPLVSGILKGIKGQYLIFDCGVLNIRKFSGYELIARPAS